MLSAGCVICQVTKWRMSWIRLVACTEHDMYKNLTEGLEGRILTNFGTMVSYRNSRNNFEVRHPHCVSQNHKIKQQTLESQNTTILFYIYVSRMMVTANQLHVSASYRPSSGCTSNEKGWGLYNIQCDFYLMTRSRSSYHVHYNQVKLGRST